MVGKGFHFSDFCALQIFPTAISLALVALIEQLMTTEVVNEMTKTTCNSHRESFGLGIANIFAGWLGGMGGNAMIAHSMLQVAAGGKYRLAYITVGVRSRNPNRSTLFTFCRHVSPVY